MKKKRKNKKLEKSSQKSKSVFGKLLLPFSFLGRGIKQLIQMVLVQPVLFILKGLFMPSRKGKVRLVFVFILLLSTSSFLVDVPEVPKVKHLEWLDVFNRPSFHLGLDLAGGAQLVYEADLSATADEEKTDALEATKEIIERRVNAFGVAEPVVQTNISGQHYRVMVELPGVTDIGDAIARIGETPVLEFRKPEFTKLSDLPEEERPELPEDAEITDDMGFSTFIPTELTGQYLEHSQVQFDQNTGMPIVGLQFDDTGKQLFADLTKEFVGQQIAIYLDNDLVSAPVVNEPILNGQAVISGNFTLVEAKETVRRLNAGALPVPVEIIAQSTVGASLGQESLDKSLRAALIGLFLVAIFMIIFYRLSGLISVLALIIYSLIVLAIFKLWPVVLSLAGIAGFVLSVGMAVDANVLIFERMREELKEGFDFSVSLEQGFNRAWTSIRDSNVSSLITCSILAWFGTSIIRGFAITLAIGILISMFSAITVTRTFLRILSSLGLSKWKWLY